MPHPHDRDKPVGLSTHESTEALPSSHSVKVKVISLGGHRVEARAISWLCEDGYRI